MSDATPHESMPLKETTHRQCLGYENLRASKEMWTWKVDMKIVSYFFSMLDIENYIQSILIKLVNLPRNDDENM